METLKQFFAFPMIATALMAYVGLYGANVRRCSDFVAYFRLDSWNVAVWMIATFKGQMEMGWHAPQPVIAAYSDV